MKKLLGALMLAASLATNGLIYPTTMVIDSIENDTIRLVTATGFVYEMEGAEDYEIGDLVSVLMFSNGTKVITDDVIVDSRYSGFYVQDHMIAHN